MKRNRRKRNLLIESPASATGDIAFNLIVFFLVCASVQPDTGRKQTIPKSETVEEQKQTENLKVDLTRTTVAVNAEPVPIDQLKSYLQRKLAGKTTPDDRVVIVKSQIRRALRSLDQSHLADRRGGGHDHPATRRRTHHPTP